MKNIITWVMVVLMTTTVSAFEWNIGKYTIRYDKPEIQTIGDMPEQAISQEEHSFEKYVQLANNDKQVQLILKNLDYERIGFIDTDTNTAYTFFISQEGIITQVHKGLLNPNVTLQGSLKGLENDYNNGNYYRMQKRLKMPFKMRLKLMIMQIL